MAVQTELTDLSRAETETTRLYQLLQSGVDREIQQVGFIPDETYALFPEQKQIAHSINGDNGSSPVSRHSKDNWACSDKQRNLIEDIIRRQNLDMDEIEQLSLAMFDEVVCALHKKQASELIDHLFERTATRNRSGSRSRRMVNNSSNGSGK